MNGLFWVPLLLGMVSQPPTPGGDMPADPNTRLDFMKKYMTTHDIRALDESGTRFRLRAEPVLHFTNPVGGARDGALFLWLDADDRPAAASQLLWLRQRIWGQEFSSLSTGRLIAKYADGHVWSPSKGGASFQPVPGAAKPAETPDRRLRQMRELAAGFSAEGFFQGRTWNHLRLLTQPSARYGKPGSDVQDGALFCFALATDPEVLLMLESRLGKDGPEWQFAFAPMSGFALKTFWKGKAIWSKPAEGNGSARDPSNTFHIHRVSAEVIDEILGPATVKP